MTKQYVITEAQKTLFQKVVAQAASKALRFGLDDCKSNTKGEAS